MVFFLVQRILYLLCSLTREERRKRNVDGLVCGSLGEVFFKISDRIWRHVFQEKMLIPDQVIFYLIGV